MGSPPEHHEHTSVWWPEDRIKAILDTKYIVSRLQPDNVPRLFDLPRWGEGLTSETYMEWILLKAGRLFLILDAIGIPDRIFALVDESCDDDDLPIAEQNVHRLGLSPMGATDAALETKFFLTQWRYLVRGIGQGEHVVYTPNEGVPVEVARATTGISTSTSIQGRDDTADQVILAGTVCRMYLRTQIQVGGAPHFFSATEVLEEIRTLRRLAHPHLLSVYASYFVDDTVCVLFGAEAERTLHSFIVDEPPSFSKWQSKEFRRQTLITWPHCLAAALAWLHAQGYAHTAIRPSNVLVDSRFNILLGQFQALDSLLAPPRVNDLEAYQYSAPERWARTAAATTAAGPAMEPTSSSNTLLLPSGGRTGRRKKPSPLALSALQESRSSSPDGPRPDSAASKGTVIRIGLSRSPSRFSLGFSSASSSSASSSSSAYAASTLGGTDPPSTTTQSRSAFWSRSRAFLSTPSITSSKSSTSTSSSTDSSFSFSLSPPSFPLSPSSSSSSSLVQATRPGTSTTSTSSSSSTSTSTSTPFQSDIFSLAAITLDILTHLCKRSLSAFTSHRAARNRSAGRGGGMADASFHLSRNAIQIQSWITLLEGDALKRCRRDRPSDRAFHAVPRMLIVLRAMLAAEPEKRPSARRVKRGFASAIREAESGGNSGLGLRLHCVEGEGGREEEEGGKQGGRRTRRTSRRRRTSSEYKEEEKVELSKTHPYSRGHDDTSVPDFAASSLSSSSLLSTGFEFGLSYTSSDSETNETSEDGHGIKPPTK
ncbi:hypothetical protein POX_b02856 [Penicillium oxalicum]|uniref:hypothetical protein n=1 Tax=Penicillium oxalicum TaxID=69781 RepID=UPI0020B87D14|nr:hypothetical protein POX_b02856 [Penicillium oxalicum]KAI2792813.1 hypothetical protein POX_b02856 [Penicillium oxalicum]